MHTNTNISIPDTLTTPTLSPSANSLARPFPPSPASQWLPQALPNNRIPPRPPYLPHNSPQSPQTQTKSHGMAIKCTSPFPAFYLSLTPSIPQVQHLHLGLLQKARLSQDRKRTGHRGRHLSRLQTAYQRTARSSFRVRPSFLSLSTRLIRSLGGGAYFGYYFRPKTMVPDLRMQCSITRCLTPATSTYPPHLVPDFFRLVSSIKTS